MAFNQFMHPRNIYRQKPNFEEIAKSYPEFASHLAYDSKQKAFIDYSNIDSLRSLTKTLLKKDFNLDVEIPEERLIPTLPLRLNYILWIEDLLNHCRINNNITGIDIGTGCCAIFPLLGTTLNNDWRFVATEVEPVNLKYAILNVCNNNRNDRIEIYHNQNPEVLFKNVLEHYPDFRFNFVMTNPPFFEDTFNDSFESFKPKNHGIFHNRRMNVSIAEEAIYEGGEIDFIRKIIDESFKTRTKVDIYTVMIGRKRSFIELKSILKNCSKGEKISFNFTELCQGNTKRWAMAWSFSDKFDISKAPKITCTRGKPFVYYLPPDITTCNYDMKSIADYIKNLLINDLNIETFSVIETRKRIEFDIKSKECNWKNQRKKRREQKIKEMSSSTFHEEMDSKRTLDIRGDDPNNNLIARKKFKESSDLCKTDLTYSLHCGLIIKRDKQDIFIKMFTKEMSQNKDSTYQLFQYFKNKLI